MRPFIPLFLALGLLLASRPALAASFAAPEPPGDAVLPGTIVQTTLPPLPLDADECELFLVPEGGAPIRVSAEVPAGAGVVRWRMPVVAARRARLVLRVGDEHEERDSAPSASFELAAVPDDESDRVRRGRSELGVRIESCVGASESELCESPAAPSLLRGERPASASRAPSAPSLIAPAARTVGRVVEARGADRVAASLRGRSNLPAFTPLRN